MSNLQSAHSAIQAELNEAKEIVAHYQSRIASLERAVLRIVQVDTPGAVSEKHEKSGKHSPANPGRGRPKGSKKSAAKANGSASKLPSTGGDYWINLITDQPQSSPDVLESAIGKLGFEPSKIQVKQLANRMTFTLNTLVKAGKIQDSGSGRARRFFKA